VGYFINQQYYAEVLCENKDKEDSCCEGKCAMEKELVSLNEKEEPQPTNSPNSNIKITKVEEAIVTTLKFYPPSGFLTIIRTTFESELKQGEMTVLFKPPTV
jgi:hypothetical protein